MGGGEGLGPLASFTRKGSIIDTARELIDRLEEEPTKVESWTVISVVTLSGAGFVVIGINAWGFDIREKYSPILLTVEY